VFLLSFFYRESKPPFCLHYEKSSPVNVVYRKINWQNPAPISAYTQSEYRISNYVNHIRKYLRQPSIDFDFCNISSPCDVVYKGRWLTQAGYWFILRFCRSASLLALKMMNEWTPTFFKYFYAGIVQSNLCWKIHNKYVFHVNIHIFVLKYLVQIQIIQNQFKICQTQYRILEQLLIIDNYC
jgi:hypothetical protein